MDWMKYRIIYFALSAVVIIAGVFSLFKWGLNLGLDFKGGSVTEFRFQNQIPEETVKAGLEKDGYKVSSIEAIGEKTYIFKLPPLSENEKEAFENSLKKNLNSDFEELRFETVGPSIGPELIRKTIYAIIISAGAILLWVAYQFKSIKFGSAAILAMFHDSLVLVGLFSLFGHFWQAEIDFLFVTALLTILSFSVHDTIVVYDRIRESQRKFGGNLYSLANKATTETMVRSLNNSFTIIFMLVALVLLGGSTLRWFAVALLIGTISGTYSSPFVAVPILVTWDEIVLAIRNKRPTKSNLSLNPFKNKL